MTFIFWDGFKHQADDIVGVSPGLKMGHINMLSPPKHGDKLNIASQRRHWDAGLQMANLREIGLQERYKSKITQILKLHEQT